MTGLDTMVADTLGEAFAKALWFDHVVMALYDRLPELTGYVIVGLSVRGAEQFHVYENPLAYEALKTPAFSSYDYADCLAWALDHKKAVPDVP